MLPSDSIEWPKRAVVTAGMPYGNKSLHFGHVGGVFVPADCYARFLRDRIGADNVRFVSGTDCYGSPIDEGYRKAVEAGTFEGTISDYVQRNHEAQKKTLESYDVSLDMFEGSGIGHAGEVHTAVSALFVEKLHEKGFLHLQKSLQFYDTEAETFLNGRQVQGHCPVQGCKSSKAYADECDLGHQYDPADLINPHSTVTGSVPEMREVENWYFDLPEFTGIVRDYNDKLKQDEQIRPVVTQTVAEFLVPPIIYIKNEAEPDYRAVSGKLPIHHYREAQGNKQSFELEFDSVADRDVARSVLGEAGIRYRTGKALVPFRISGNIEWGVPCPTIDGVSGLCLWCWPESLWAPISFTIASNDKRGLPRDYWRKFWCRRDAKVYQFIGQDNLYFYGVAQPALFAATQSNESIKAFPEDGKLQQTELIANHHILFGDKKASSSGDIKPPTADELLNYYTPEQLRAHWLALALDQKSVGFKPKPFEPDDEKRNDPRVSDPVLKEGALLTNVFNRLARSCFYEAGKNFEGYMPIGPVSPEVSTRVFKTMKKYDATMYQVDLHSIMTQMDEFLHYANKYWSDNIRRIEKEEGGEGPDRRQTLLDSFFLLRIATLLMHPVVPAGCEKICDYMNFPFEEFFSWNYDFDSMEELCSGSDHTQQRHHVRELPPRTDFFAKHESQFKKKK